LKYPAWLEDKLSSTKREKTCWKMYDDMDAATMWLSWRSL
jgi:hypothetical protein